MNIKGEKKENSWVDLDPSVVKIVEILDNLPENLKGEAFSKAFMETWEDSDKTFSLINYATKLAKARSSSKGEFKQRLPIEIHEYLYKTILETGQSKEFATRMAAEVFNKTEQWINELSALSSPKQVSYVARSNNTHPKQVDMKRKGVVTAKDLTSHQNPAGQLKRLEKGVGLYEWIKSVEDRVEGLEDELKETKAVVSTTNKSVSKIEGILGSGLSNKEKIQTMKDQGISQKRTSELLDVSLSTVKRNWR